MNDIQSIIIKDTYSLTQFKHRIRLLKTSLVKKFFGSAEENLTFSAPDIKWLRSLPPDFSQQFNKDNVYKIFSDLEMAVNKLNVLTMYLTFEPDDATISQIGAYARKNFNSPELFLDIKIDPNLIAGTTLAWKGISKDYSLRAKIEEKKGDILEGFKKILR